MLVFLLRCLVAVLGLDVVAQLGRQLTSTVEPLGAIGNKVVITEDLADLRQVDHVRVVQAVVVRQVLVENFHFVY